MVIGENGQIAMFSCLLFYTFFCQFIVIFNEMLVIQDLPTITCLLWLLFVYQWNLLSTTVEYPVRRSGYFKLMPFKGFKNLGHLTGIKNQRYLKS